MPSVSDIARTILNETHGPDDVRPVYKRGVIHALKLPKREKPFRLDMTDPHIDDLLRLVGAPRRLN